MAGQNKYSKFAVPDKGWDKKSILDTYKQYFNEKQDLRERYLLPPSEMPTDEDIKYRRTKYIPYDGGYQDVAQQDLDYAKKASEYVDKYSQQNELTKEGILNTYDENPVAHDVLIDKYFQMNRDKSSTLKNILIKSLLNRK